MTRERRVTDVLKGIGIDSMNSGTSDGRGWLASPHGAVLHSHDPTTGDLIASVRATTATEYQEVVRRAQKASRDWREVPAPKRAELIRDVGTVLSERKELLSELIAIEMGKTVREAAGEIGECEHCAIAEVSHAS